MNLSIKSSQAKQLIDVTGELDEILHQNNWQSGMLHIFVLHTTACITTADLDPGTDADYLDAFEAIMPKLDYRHPHNPEHVVDHILSSMIGPNLTVPVENGQLLLGTWQRVVLVELDGPRKREINLQFTHAST